MQPEVKIVLEKIDFINRYKNLSIKYSLNRDESFEDYNNNGILNIFNKLGYNAAFNI